ncbi:hypothetical protein CCMA1212_010701 [Trichoderma ghanense]|uniref:Uncharacterized protein n=1 Tax=Trichoderma ghanense TaxID=65468 RepID=A0ABY2GPJ9_9HYPO
MAFCGFVPGSAAHTPRPAQYHVFPQPMVMAFPSPQVLTIQYPQQQHVQPVMPLTMMMVSPPPVFVMPTTFSLQLPLAISVSPPGATPPGRSSSSEAKGLSMRIVFYGHSDSDGYALTDASWSRDDLPSRDKFLAAVGK